MVLTAAYTDVGIRKTTNQDSYCIKVANTQKGTAVLAVICDGMGGLSSGEIASANVIYAFSDWFNEVLPTTLKYNSLSDIEKRWDDIIKEQNSKVAAYGDKNNAKLGTTATALFILGDTFMLIGHVGDSRVYRIGREIQVLTTDQTVVAREIERGNMTVEQAKKDPRRNVLLQCIGASEVVVPEFITGVPTTNTTYMLCSDGFRHLITAEEIQEAFAPTVLTSEAVMVKKAKELVRLNMERGEVDNITAILIKM